MLDLKQRVSKGLCWVRCSQPAALLSLGVTSQGTWTVSMGALRKSRPHCSREHLLKTHFSCSVPNRNLEKLGFAVWDGCGISCATAQLGQGREAE